MEGTRMHRLCAVAVFVLATAGVAYASGEISLIDAGGLEFYINTNLVTTYTSSASGAASDASFTTSVSGVTTTGGDTTTTTLTDAFDGYGGISMKVDDAEYVIYGDNGTASMADGGRTVVFNTQTINEIDVFRKVFVPADDEFCRWLNVLTNTGASTKTIVLAVCAYLGYDNCTRIRSTSSGDIVATINDNWWVSADDPTCQDPPSSVLYEPRLGHVLQGPGAAVRLSSFTFKNDDGSYAWWEYTFDLAPGETAIIMNLVTGQPNLNDAERKARSLTALSGSALDFMTDTEKQQVINFAATASGFGCIGGALADSPALPLFSRLGGDMLMPGLVIGVLIALSRRRAPKPAQA